MAIMIHLNFRMNPIEIICHLSIARSKTYSSFTYVERLNCIGKGFSNVGKGSFVLKHDIPKADSTTSV